MLGPGAGIGKIGDLKYAPGPNLPTGNINVSIQVGIDMYNFISGVLTP